MTLPVSWTTVSLMLMTLPAVNSRTSADSATIANFAGRAEATMRAKWADKYTFPLAPSPYVETLATDYACYLLLTRRIFTTERQNDSPWVDRFKEALDDIDKVASGEISLVDSAGVIIARSDSTERPWSNTMGYLPTTTEDDVRSQVTDPNKIEDIKSERDF